MLERRLKAEEEEDETSSVNVEDYMSLVTENVSVFVHYYVLLQLYISPNIEWIVCNLTVMIVLI